MTFRAATRLQGPITGRPAAGVSRRFYLATDEGKLYYDDGVDWHEVGARLVSLSVGGEVEIDSQQREPFVVALDDTYAIACDGVSPFPRYYLLQYGGGSLTLLHAHGGDLSLYNEGYNASAGFFGITRIDSTRVFVAFGGRNSSTSASKYVGKVLTHDGSTITAHAHAAWLEATGGVVSGGYATAMSTPAGDVDTGAVVYWNSSTGTVQGRKVTFTDTTVSYGTDTQIESVGKDVQWARPFNNTGDLCVLWEDGGLYAVHLDIDVFTPTLGLVSADAVLDPQCDHLSPGKVAVGWVDSAFTDRYAVEVDWDGSLVSVGAVSGLGAGSTMTRSSPTKRWGSDAFHGWSETNNDDVSPNGYNGTDLWVHVGALTAERFLQFAGGNDFDFAAFDDSNGVVVFENIDAFGNLGSNTMAAVLSRSG